MLHFPAVYIYCSWSPNSTYLYLDFYLLSWRWWPLWSGGTLYQWSLKPEKASPDRCLFKISVSWTLRLSRSRKWDEKLSKTCQKPVCFTEFSVCPEMLQQQFRTNRFGLNRCCNISGQIQFDLNCCSNISGQIEFDLICCCNISGQTEKMTDRPEKNCFFGRSYMLFSPFNWSWSSSCI